MWGHAITLIPTTVHIGEINTHSTILGEKDLTSVISCWSLQAADADILGMYFSLCSFLGNTQRTHPTAHMLEREKPTAKAEIFSISAQCTKPHMAEQICSGLQ